MNLEFSWRDVSAVAAALATAAFVGSAIHDFGYLAALGLTFSQVPTTLGDQTRSALIWSPLVAGAFVGVLLLNMIFWPKEQRPYDMTKPSDRRVWKIEGVVVLLAGSSQVAVWLWHGEAQILVGAFGLSLLFIELSLWAFKRGFLVGAPLILRDAMSYGVPAGILLFSLGWSGAYSAYHSSDARALTQVSADQTVMVRVLRIYEEGFLYRTEDRVQFERWDGASIVTRANRFEWSGAFCAWRTCSAPEDTPV